MIKNFALICFTILVLAGCKEGERENSSLLSAQEIIAEVSGEFAPDKRVAMFDVEAEERGEGVFLRGESNLPDAVNSLRTRLKERNVSFTDSITVLPSDEIRSTTMGVIKISVANLRGKAAHSSELVTQAILGTPVKVYKKSENWYLIQTPDDYLAWVDSGGIELFSESEYKEWKTANKLIFLEPFGFSYKDSTRDSERISDVVAGNIFELQGEKNNFYKIKYPDGRLGFVEKQNSRPYNEWLENVEISEESLVQTSKDLMGLPYLWGGTSAKGVDCSGYTKTVFFLNGLIIPRDASQQIHTGVQVDSTRNFENLIPGDLLFFGRPATETTSEKVIHVGIWIGNNKFIHSMGDVHISNMDQEAEDFDEYNYNRYLRSKRVAGQEHERLIYLKQNDIFNEPVAEKSEGFRG